MATVTVTAAIFTAPTITVTSSDVEALDADGDQTFRSVATITQSASAIAAGATAQYSTDNGVTWVNGTTVDRNLTAGCDGTDSWTVQGRSIANAGTATEEISGVVTDTGTLTVDPPDASFDINLTGDCVNTNAYVGTQGGNLINSVTAGQTCAGVINTAGQTRTLIYRLRAGNVFFETTGRIYAGDTLPTGMVDGNAATITAPSNVEIHIEGDYETPGTSGTDINVSCTGGAFRIVPTAGAGIRPGYSTVTVPPGTTDQSPAIGGVAGLYVDTTVVCAGAPAGFTVTGPGDNNDTLTITVDAAVAPGDFHTFGRDDCPYTYVIDTLDGVGRTLNGVRANNWQIRTQ